MSISILIVSWNVADMLCACLRSIYASLDVAHASLSSRPSCEIIVVDSASTDDTVERVRREFPAVHLLPQTENVGFTRGNNLALHAAVGDYLLLLNPDTRILDDAIRQMAAYLDTHPEVGVVGPHTLNPDGTHQSTRRRFPTFWTGVFESTWLQPLAPRIVLDRYYAAEIADDAPAASIDWVQGSALMLRRAVYEQIGGLDEGYVMYSEELDWCRRAKQVGWEVVYLGTAKLIHYGGKSSEQAGARTHIHFQQSKLRYFRKYHGKTSAAALRGIILANYAFQYLLEAGKALLGHKRALRRERMATYAGVLRSGLRITAP